MSIRNLILEGLAEERLEEVKSVDDFKYHVYVNRGKGWELGAWYDDVKKANKEADFLLKKGYKVEVRVNEEFIIVEGVYSNFKVPKRDIQKMQEYYQKGSNPIALASTVKTVDKAVARYYISVAAGWQECKNSFYQRCRTLGVTEDDLHEIYDKAIKDTSISLGDAPTHKPVSKSGSSKVSTPTVKREKKQASSGELYNTGDGWSPFA